MAAAFLAVLPLARWRLLEHANMLGACCDPHGIGFPERKSIDRAA
jgi:hypothetical protein